jgi:hypothetical protein
VDSPAAAASLEIVRGECIALFAYDAGLSIDLVEAEHRIRAEREFIKHKRRAPKYFEYHPPPLRVVQREAPLPVGNHSTGEHVDLVLFDFGAVSVAYTLPLHGSLSDLIELRETLDEHAGLLEDSRRRVERLCAAIAPAIGKPHIAGFVETYTLFHIRELSPPCTADELLQRHTGIIAQLLRSERMVLSSGEVDDATSLRISYGVDDVAVIDWDSSLLVGAGMEDVRAVLEFANVELLEMRYLDQRLDDALEEAYNALARRSWRHSYFPRSSHADLRHVAELQVDGAIVFEGVNNALKLVGDQYLARVYRLVSSRFHMPEWDESILRKLQVLDSIYHKMSDVAASWRLEVLEWIIIILIALSIVVTFIPGATH